VTWYRRLANLVRPQRLSRDVDREMAFHLAELADDLVAGGMSESPTRGTPRVGDSATGRSWPSERARPM
jgi:hypothetical protein